MFATSAYCYNVILAQRQRHINKNHRQVSLRVAFLFFYLGNQSLLLYYNIMYYNIKVKRY